MVVETGAGCCEGGGSRLVGRRVCRRLRWQTEGGAETGRQAAVMAQYGQAALRRGRRCGEEAEKQEQEQDQEEEQKEEKQEARREEAEEEEEE